MTRTVRFVSPDLVQRARAGESGALDTLLEALGRQLLPTAAALAGPADAEVLLSDTLSRVYERLGQLKESAALVPWARQIMVRLFSDELRRRRRDERIQVELRQARTGSHDFRSTELRDAVARLAPPERTVLVLHYWLGLTLDECALEIGIPPGTVRSRLHAAITRLRTGFGGQ